MQKIGGKPNSSSNGHRGEEAEAGPAVVSGAAAVVGVAGPVINDVTPREILIESFIDQIFARHCDCQHHQWDGSGGGRRYFKMEFGRIY